MKKHSSSYNPEMHNRRSIRLKGYDYSSEGVYFVTICCQDYAPLFGKVEQGELLLNEAGKMVLTTWLALPKRFPSIELDEFVIMPNHFHALLHIQAQKQLSPYKLGDIIGAFKSLSTVAYIRGVKEKGWTTFNGRLWQRDYYEHIVRHIQAHFNIANYIVENPSKWNEDKYNCASLS